MASMEWDVVTAAGRAALRAAGDSRVGPARGRHQRQSHVTKRSRRHTERHTYPLWCMGAQTGSTGGLRWEPPAAG